jgi:beta-phosphoglucomutase family hydrolase
MLGLPDSIRVLLFDLDGVLTSTAVLHRRAWKQAFDTFLRARDPAGFVPFTEDDYLEYVDGRPRSDGVRTFLRARGIEADEQTVEGIGTGKNDEFLACLARGEVESYPGSVRYLEAAEQAGLKIGVVTSSKNGEVVLDAANLTRFVAARVDGRDIVAAGLRGKPAPDGFLAGAKAFGAQPVEAAVFEDAIAGVEAGRAGDFGFVVGVDRVGGDQAAAMRAAGADVVVTDLAELLAR